MNRALPPGDRGYRGPNPGRSSGCARPVPGIGRLVGGVTVVASQIRNGLLCVILGRRAFTVRIGQPPLHAIKHGGFARFWRETPCAVAPNAARERTATMKAVADMFVCPDLAV